MKLKYSTPNKLKSTVDVDVQRLKQIVEELSFERVYGNPGNEVAAEVVKKYFTDIGGEITEDAERNILLGNLDANILIGAHYDSVPGSPGADDNASAVAVMLETARILSGKNVLFAAWNGEEFGLRGSRFFVSKSGSPVKFKQVHILEMVGYTDKSPNSQKSPIPMMETPTVGDFLGVVGNKKELVNKIINTAKSVSIPVVGMNLPEGLSFHMIEQVSPHLLRSDHAPFWEEGVPAVMWTDTSEFRNPNYHKFTDTPDTLDYEFMAEVVKLLVEVVNGSSII